VPEHLVHQLGQLPTDLGALVEPIAVSFHAVRLSRIGPGQTAVVFGAGRLPGYLPDRDHPATIRLVQDGRIDTGGLITTRLVGCGW
jgi:hypothetical protein